MYTHIELYFVHLISYRLWALTSQNAQYLGRCIHVNMLPIDAKIKHPDEPMLNQNSGKCETNAPNIPLISECRKALPCSFQSLGKQGGTFL